MKKQRVTGALFLAFGVISVLFQVFSEMWFALSGRSGTGIISYPIIAGIVLSGLAMMMILKCPMKNVLKAFAGVCLVGFIYSAIMAVRCIGTVLQSGSSGFLGNFLAQTAANSLPFRIADAVVLLIMSILIFMLASGRKLRIACIILGSVMVILSLFVSITDVVFAAFYITVAIMSGSEASESASCEAV